MCAHFSEKILISKFDAFRFPASDMVQFRALVTPCMPKCEPVVCDVLDYTGQTRQVDSYGRKKRWTTNPLTQSRQKRESDPEEVLVVQTLRIVDRYGRRTGEVSEPRTEIATGSNETRYQFIEDNDIDLDHGLSAIIEKHSHRCVEENTLISGAVIFLVIQVSD